MTARPEVEITRVHPHPHLSRRVSLWAAGRRRSLPRKHYKDFVKHAATNRGHEQTRQRAQKWSETSATAAQWLATLEWKRIRRVLGLGPWGEHIIYRLKARAFSLYDVRNERHGCPHASCLHEVDVDLHHVFWTCPAARRLRAIFVSAWKRLGLPERETEQACFGLELPMVPPALWEAAANSRNGQDDRNVEMAECVTALAEGCWRLGAALYFHAIWRWRVQHFDATNDVSEARHQLLFANRLRQGYYNMHLYVRPNRGHPTLSAAVGIVVKALCRPWQGSHQEVRLDNPTCHYRLFFDGESRGNPGPGGSGAVVARLTQDGGPFQLVWAGTMSFAAPSTTNNVAENLGLLAGLTACQRHGYSPLHVVGDSAMTFGSIHTGSHRLLLIYARYIGAADADWQAYNYYRGSIIFAHGT